VMLGLADRHARKKQRIATLLVALLANFSGG